jgi:hypothetical protein
MTTDRRTLAALFSIMAVMSPAAAQTSQTAEPTTVQTAPVRGLERLESSRAPTPTPQTSPTQSAPDASAIPVPATPRLVLPTVTAPDRPAPRPAVRPRVRATPSAERTTPQAIPPAATEAAAPAAETPRSPVAESSTSAPAPTDAPVTQAAPTPAPATTQPALTAPETGRAMPLWLSLAVIIVVLAALWALRRRKPASRHRRRPESETIIEPTAKPITPEPDPAPAAPATPIAAAAEAPKFLEPRGKTAFQPTASTPTAPTPVAAPRARLTCELQPRRAGLNLLSATVECELVVTNIGGAPAEAIRAAVSLLTAHAGQDIDLAEFNAAPIGRPVTAPFTLAVGESRTIRTVTAIAREAIRTMTAANRPMFVPVLASNVLYATSGDEAQTARAWVIGIERVDSAKLAPFWLDAPPRMYTNVVARPHAATFDR